MLTVPEVKELNRRLSEELSVPDAGPYKDIAAVVYRVELLPCDGSPYIYRHVDIEYTYGSYYSIDEKTPLFRFVQTLTPLPMVRSAAEFVLYQGDGEPEFTREDLEEARRQIGSTLHKLREVLRTLEAKEDPGRYKSQITLAQRRIRAFELAVQLIENQLEQQAPP